MIVPYEIVSRVLVFYSPVYVIGKIREGEMFHPLMSLIFPSAHL
jgi:hypothetical protein